MNDEAHAWVTRRLHYDEQTGVFIWRQHTYRHRIGTVASNGRRKGYVVIWIDGKTYSGHRLAWLYTFGSWPTLLLDHINGIRDDNRLINLREVRSGENSQNLKRARRDNRSGYLGVHSSRGKWMAQIQVDGLHRNLGRFDTPEEAYRKYVEAKRVLHPAGTL